MAQINFCKTQLWNCLESMKLWVIKLVLSMLDNWLYIYVTVSMLLRTQKRDTKLYTTGNTVIHWTFGPEFCLNIVILKRVAKP